MKTQHVILFLLISIFCSSLPSVRAENVDIGFAVPQPVVYDVPFSVNVNVNTHDVKVIEYGLTVSTNSVLPLFSQASHSKNDRFTQNDAFTGRIQNNLAYRLFTGWHGKSGEEWSSGVAQSLFTINNVKFQGINENDAQGVLFDLVAVADPQNFFTPATGSTIDGVVSIPSIAVVPQLSLCGDGVVGYLDANQNGIKEGTEANEACDTGAAGGSTENDEYIANRDGCSADCRYVDIDYTCTNINFGARNSVCTKLPAKQILINRVTALINGQCYRPDHGFPEYCVAGQPSIQYDQQNKIDGATKIRLVTEVGRALRQFFQETAQ